MKLNPNYGVAIKKVPFFLKLNFMLLSSYERQKFFCFEELKSKKKEYMIILKLLLLSFNIRSCFQMQNNNSRTSWWLSG